MKQNINYRYVFVKFHNGFELAKFLNDYKLFMYDIVKLEFDILHDEYALLYREYVSDKE